MVLTRAGWLSLVAVHREFEAARHRKAAPPAIEVCSLNLITSSMEWKRVTHTQCFPASQRRLYRLQGATMDVVATEEHRMITGRVEKGRLTADLFRPETVGQLLGGDYRRNSRSLGKLEYDLTRVVPRSAVNRQPAFKLAIAGLQATCDWWWEQDRQRGFLRFFGFWLGNGHLAVDHGFVSVSQGKLTPSAWLIDLLDEVFPRWWRRERSAVDAQGITFRYHIRCPPLFDWLRLCAVGPPGYNALDPVQLRGYPHFKYEETLAAKEAEATYAPRQAGHWWTQEDMLDAIRRGPVLRPCCVCHDPSGERRLVCSGLHCSKVEAITRAHPTCVDREDATAFDEPWYCSPDCQRDGQPRPPTSSNEEEEEEQARGVVWSNGVWDIDINGDWFYLKRWMGPNVAGTIANLSQPQAVALLEGFCRADGVWKDVHFEDAGCEEPTGIWRCNSSSFPLIHHLQLVGLLAGAPGDLSIATEEGKENTAGPGGRKVRATVDNWRITFKFRKPYFAKELHVSRLAKPLDVTNDLAARGYYKYEDDGCVYDLTVAGNGNFLTQRLSVKQLTATGGGRAGEVQPADWKCVRAHPVFVGNCQSLNFLAGFLLLFFSEEDAFWLMTAVVNASLPADYFTHSMLGLHTDLNVLALLISTHLPRLHQHLRALHVDIRPIAFPWFLSLYIKTLPIESCLRVWDSFVLEGSKLLFRIALGLLSLHEERLVRVAEFGRLYSLISVLGAAQFDCERLMQEGFSMRGVSRRTVERLRRRERRAMEREHGAAAAASLTRLPSASADEQEEEAEGNWTEDEEDSVEMQQQLEQAAEQRRRSSSKRGDSDGDDDRVAEQQQQQQQQRRLHSASSASSASSSSSSSAAHSAASTPRSSQRAATSS